MKEIHVRQKGRLWFAECEGCAGLFGTSRPEAVGMLIDHNPEAFGVVIVQHPKQCEGCEGRDGR